MHSFEVSLGYESVDRTTFSTWSATLPGFIENVLRSTLSYPNETSNECIQFLNKGTKFLKKNWIIIEKIFFTFCLLLLTFIFIKCKLQKKNW
jgi:hypothetical protein